MEGSWRPRERTGFRRFIDAYNDANSAAWDGTYMAEQPWYAVRINRSRHWEKKPIRRPPATLLGPYGDWEWDPRAFSPTVPSFTTMRRRGEAANLIARLTKEDVESGLIRRLVFRWMAADLGAEEFVRLEDLLALLASCYLTSRPGAATQLLPVQAFR